MNEVGKETRNSVRGTALQSGRRVINRDNTRYQYKIRTS